MINIVKVSRQLKIRYFKKNEYKEKYVACLSYNASSQNNIKAEESEANAPCFICVFNEVTKTRSEETKKYSEIKDKNI